MGAKMIVFGKTQSAVGNDGLRIDRDGICLLMASAPQQVEKAKKKPKLLKKLLIVFFHI